MPTLTQTKTSTHVLGEQDFKWRQIFPAVSKPNFVFPGAMTQKLVAQFLRQEVVGESSGDYTSLYCMRMLNGLLSNHYISYWINLISWSWHHSHQIVQSSKYELHPTLHGPWWPLIPLCHPESFFMQIFSRRSAIADFHLEIFRQCNQRAKVPPKGSKPTPLCF